MADTIPNQEATITLIVDGVAKEITNSADVGNGEKLEISGDVIQSGEQDGINLILTLASGKKVVLENFFDSPKLLLLPTVEGSTIEINSQNNTAFESLGIVEFDKPANLNLFTVFESSIQIDNLRDPILDSNPEFYHSNLIRDKGVYEQVESLRQDSIKEVSRQSAIEPASRVSSQSNTVINNVKNTPVKNNILENQNNDLTKDDDPIVNIKIPEVIQVDTTAAITSKSIVNTDETSNDDAVLHTITFKNIDLNASEPFKIHNDTNNLFEINDQGQITLQDNKSLDFENLSSYSFTITVSDKDNNILSQNITIDVNDINDEKPIIKVSNNQVSEAISDTDILNTISYTDRDSDETNGTFVYSIVDDPSDLFEVNDQGQITLQDGKSLDYSSSQFHTIAVSLSDGLNNSSQKQIMIEVEIEDDINNQAPLINSALSSAVVTENTSGVLTTVEYTDIDTTNGAFTFTLVDDASGMFEINSATGEISLVAGKELDFETAQSYTLQAKVNDGVNTSHVDDVTITLNDENDETPIIISSPNISSLENVSSGTILHTINFTDADTYNGMIEYSIVSDTDNLFDIDEFGNILLQEGKSLDYETQTSHAISVKVNDGINDSIVQNITINVSDINDNAPTITSITSATTDESINDSTVIHTVYSSDADANNGTTVYTITEDASSLFEIDSSTGEISLKTGQILDSESANSYSIKVSVNDGINTSTEQTITIDVNDINDNTPVISSISSFTTSEDVSATNILHTVTYTDADISNDIVSYTITQDTANLFEVNQNGQITLQDGKTLDKESEDTYSIQVKVNDGVNDSIVQTIAISVIDVNDNNPSIISRDNATVSESLNATTTILDVNSIDADSGDTLSFSIVEDSSSLFEIDNNGIITLKSGASLDYETQTSYTLKVQSSDGIHSTDSQLITINVTDVNDTPPVILTGNQVMNENSMSALFQINTSDVDSVNGSTSYELTDSASGIFTISPDGYVSYSDGVPDSGDYTISVVVNDGVNDSIAKNIIITVPVIDNINVAPVIDAVASAGTALEDIDDSTVITTVAWSDQDGLPEVDSILTYALTNNAGGLFEIDSTTGEVSLVAGQSLDYETSSSHTISATVGDGTNISTAANITISVADVNDNAPSINSENSIDISESVDDGTVLHSITFSDVDTTNGNTSYTISDSPFKINDVGEITLRPGQSLDYESIDSYNVEVTVNDGVNRSQTQTITFNITDTNDEIPTLESNTSISLDETIDADTTIYTLSSSDADALSSTFTYSLNDDSNGLFEVNSTTGVISLASGKELDYETSQTHTIQAIVSDGVNSSLTQTITINVNDINDETPTITSLEGSSVLENISPSDIIHRVTFDDSDMITSMDDYTYTLVSDVSGIFEINTNGEISLIDGNSLDYESDRNYSIEVQVSDSVQNSQIQTINISVSDVNDTAPIITSVSAISAAENIDADEVIHQVLYNDSDSTNDTFTYTITQDNSNIFEVNSSTGEISLKNGSALDFEGETQHTLMVQVDDGINSTVQTITLNVTNVDDESPQITSSSTVQVLEILSEGSEVIDVDAFDTTSTNLTYSIEDVSGKFEIDSTTGIIVLSEGAILNHDDAPSHTMIVTVADEVGNTITQNITVNVEKADDINNVAPIIEDGDAAIFSVDEDVVSGASFGAVRLHDIDINSDSFTFSLTNDAGGLFQIDANTGEISLSAGQTLDYETATSYTVQAQVSDGVNMSEIEALTINVNDINDETPTITSATATTLNETNNDANIIHTVLFNDGDQASTNGTTIYTISEDTSDLFTINEAGQITLQENKELDYESASSHTIKVKINDGINESAEQTITINVSDTNDTAPVVTTATTSVAEDINDTTVIHTLAFTDADTTNGTTSYSLSNNSNGLFEIDSSSGEISLVAGQSLDYATNSSHTLKVIVNDGVNESLIEDIVINVNQSVTNNFAPVVTADSVSVAEGINHNSVLHKVEFTDADGVNPNSTYTLTDDANGLFEIDIDGNITLVSGESIDFSTDPSYDVRVTVNDGVNTSTEEIITLNFTNTQVISTLDVSTSVENSNFKVIGDGSSDSLGETVCLAGDFNGDGYDDFIVGARSGDTGGSNSGNAYVVYGKADGFTDISEDELNAGTGGFQIIGSGSSDNLGVVVSGAGDINGDGFDDLVIGAKNGASDKGETYVIYGQSTNITTAINFDNDFATNNIDGFIMTGISSDHSGRGLSIVGDVNGDGFDDMLIGAALGNGFENSISDAGEAYLVYGKSTGFSDFTLSDVGGVVDGITLYGRDSSDYFGRVVTGVGDMNGDGYDDILISSGRANHTSTDDGEAYVVFGSDSLSDINFDVTTLDGTNGFEINGEDVSDFLGEGTDVFDVTAGGAISGGGDINGDGFDDMIIGAGLANINATNDGAAYVIYGKADGFTNIDLNTALDGTNGFRIVGESANDKLGSAVAILGDVNGDGYADIMVNNHVDNEAYLIFGKDTPFSADFNVSTLNFDGIEAVKFTGFIHDITVISGQGDINSDGYSDILIGTDTTSGGTGNRTYTILGRDFSGENGELVVKSAVVGAIESGESSVTDNFLGSFTNDKFINISENDSVSAAAGDDSITITSNDFFRVDGGNGNDTLILNRSLDLSLVDDNRIENIEIIDIEDSGAEITLNLSEILNISSTSNTLRIDGTNGRVSIFEDGFTQEADVVINTLTYHVFSNGTAIIQIQDGLFPNINANAPTVDTATFSINEGATIAVTTAMLNASDGDTLITTDDNLVFTANATGGSFQLNGTDAVGFTLADVQDGNVTFVHDGSEIAPAYTISVSDGMKTSADTSGTFGFTQVNDNTPEMTKAEIAYKVGEDTVLKESMISSIDLDTDTVDTDMVFTISNLSNGEIKLNGIASATFNLADLKAGNVTFFDDIEQDSTFDILVTDGTFTSETLSGVIEPKPPIINLIENFHITGMGMDAQGWDIAGVGDVNGDGYDDFLMGKSSPTIRTRANYRDSSEEEVYLIYGKSDMGDNFDIADMTASQGIKITDTEGTIQGFGANVSAAGDLNGDGYDDFIIHESGIIGQNEELYVFYGSNSLSDFDVSTMGADDGFIITDERVIVEYADTSTALGYSMNALGDINHDGYDDVIISQVGNAFRSSWIIYGRETGVDIDLNSGNISSQRVELTTNSEYTAGLVVDSSGDINGDGYMDLLIYGGLDCINVIYGSDSLASTMSLESRNGNDGFQITDLPRSYNVSIVGTAGDFNGDGYDDIIADDRIVYGGDSFSTSVSLDSTNGLDLLINGSFMAISSIGDFNGDGYDDIMISSTRNEGYIVLGREESADIDLTGTVESLSDRDDVVVISNDLIEAARIGLELSYGDFNGDGFDDVIISTSWASNDSLLPTFLVYGGDYGAGNIITTTNGTGTATVENFVGSDGNDSFTSISTADTASAGAGDDDISIDSADFFRIDGGHGIDTLSFGASDISLDLTNINNKIENIEAINMGDGNGSSTLTLGLADVLDLPSSRDYADDLIGGVGTADGTSDILRIMGDANDTVDLTDFADSGSDVTVDGIAFDLYTHSSVANGDILIEQGINVI